MSSLDHLGMIVKLVSRLIRDGGQGLADCDWLRRRSEVGDRSRFLLHRVPT